MVRPNSKLLSLALPRALMLGDYCEGRGMQANLKTAIWKHLEMLTWFKEFEQLNHISATLHRGPSTQ